MTNLYLKCITLPIDINLLSGHDCMFKTHFMKRRKCSQRKKIFDYRISGNLILRFKQNSSFFLFYEFKLCNSDIMRYHTHQKKRKKKLTLEHVVDSSNCIAMNSITIESCVRGDYIYKAIRKRTTHMIRMLLLF